MSRQIQEGVNLGHADSLWTVGNFYNVVARPNFSFLQHAKVESWSVMRYEQGCHPRFIHANADAVARYARLCHFKLRVTIDIELAHHSPSRNRRFPDCGSDSFAVPGHVAWKADIY